MKIQSSNNTISVAKGMNLCQFRVQNKTKFIFSLQSALCTDIQFSVAVYLYVYVQN